MQAFPPSGPDRTYVLPAEERGTVSSIKMTRVILYAPERAMPESPVPQERYPLAKGQAPDWLVSAQAPVARQQTRAAAVTVTVPTMADGGHVRFSMIPRLMFPEYACPDDVRQTVGGDGQVPVEYPGLVRPSAGQRAPRAILRRPDSVRP